MWGTEKNSPINRLLRARQTAVTVRGSCHRPARFRRQARCLLSPSRSLPAGEFRDPQQGGIQVLSIFRVDRRPFLGNVVGGLGVGRASGFSRRGGTTRDLSRNAM